jgi:hypothetical protein
MKALLGFLISCLLLAMCSCGIKELSEKERFSLFLKTMQGDSTGYKIVYSMAENIDTLYGVFNISLEYVPLKKELDHYDSLTILFLTKRESTFNSKYIPSKDNINSTHFNWNRFNDSVQIYFLKGDSLREIIHRKAGSYEKNVKGYVVDFKTELISKTDTILIRKFDIWLSSSFPVSDIKHQKIEVL